MNSSYTHSLDYGSIFSTICFILQPKKVVEFGILNGFSLFHIVNNVSSECEITAYDIFEEFNGNFADRKLITEQFESYPNISIEYGDLYIKHTDIQDHSIDLLHVDIANNGNTYRFVMEHYLKKLTPGGIIILEGGSDERDRVEWMLKYNKPKIRPVLRTIDVKFHTIGQIPSLTIIKA